MKSWNINGRLRDGFAQLSDDEPIEPHDVSKRISTAWYEDPALLSRTDIMRIAAILRGDQGVLRWVIETRAAKVLFGSALKRVEGRVRVVRT